MGKCIYAGKPIDELEESIQRAFCDKCAGAVSRVLNVPMTIDMLLDGEIVCPHCKTILGYDDDIGYFYDDTFYCEICGQRLTKKGCE